MTPEQSAAIAWGLCALLAGVLLYEWEFKQRREDAKARLAREAAETEANRMRDFELMAASLGVAPHEPAIMCRWSPDISRQKAGVI